MKEMIKNKVTVLLFLFIIFVTNFSVKFTQIEEHNEFVRSENIEMEVIK